MGAPVNLRIAATVLRGPAILTVLFFSAVSHALAEPSPSSVEDIYILRSIRETGIASSGGCDPAKTGFAPSPADAERLFSFWSVEARSDDGQIIDTKAKHVADLRGCFGPTSERARQNFYAEIRLGSLSLTGRGECLALAIDVPETGLIPVHCQLTLNGTGTPYTGGVLTTNTLTSKASFGGDTDPPGYSQASIATLRLWRKH